MRVDCSRRMGDRTRRRGTAMPCPINKNSARQRGIQLFCPSGAVFLFVGHGSAVPLQQAPPIFLPKFYTRPPLLWNLRGETGYIYRMRIRRASPLTCAVLLIISSGIHAQNEPRPDRGIPDTYETGGHTQIDLSHSIFPVVPAVQLADFIEVATGSENGLCESLIITPNSVGAKAAICAPGGGALLAEPGDYLITAREPLNPALSETYESVDLRLRISDGGDEMQASAEATDFSRRKKPDTSFCVRISEAPDGPAISGLAVRFFQRYRVAAEGLTDGGGRFCAEQLRREPLVAAVNGGEDYHDRAVRVEPGTGAADIPLEPLHEFLCAVTDPGAFLRRHHDASFHLQPVPAPPDTALTPGTPLAWQDRGDAVRDGVRFRAYDSQLTAQGKQEEDGPPPAGITVWLSGEDYAIRFPRKADEKQNACSLTLPPPEPRRQRLDLRCPAGKYLPPGRAVYLDNRPAAVPVATSAATPAATPTPLPGGKPAVAPAEAPAAAAADAAAKPPAESPPPAAPAWEARRLTHIPEEGILNSLRLAAEFVSSENPSVMPAWDARGCTPKAVPFKADENGTMVWPLGACCIERDTALRIEKYFREARAAGAARKGGAPRHEDHSPDDLHGCLFMAQLTRKERETAAQDAAMIRIGCRGIEEIYRLLGGRQPDDTGE